MNNLVLKGLKVLEFTHVISGSYAGMLLGDLGADIIKIERPGYGEFYRSEAIKNKEGESIVFPTYNRNKKSITLNLKSVEGIQIAKDLIEKADVIIENYRPGLMKKMGLGYEEIKKINEDVIMVSISGFGQNGPYWENPAYDMTIAAMSGFMSVNGPAGEPMKAGPAISDFLSGIYGAMSVLVALKHKENTGEGQYIDVSMMECSMSILDAFFAQTKFTGVEPKGNGNRRHNYAPVNAFKSKNGSVYIACSLEKHWVKMTEVLGMPELLHDDRFKTTLVRKAHEIEIEEIVANWAKQLTTEEIVGQLEAATIPCAPIQSISQVAKDPQVLARKSIGEFDYPTLEGYPFVKFVPKFSTIETVYNSAPTLGENTDEILRSVLKKSDSDIEQLKEKKII